MQIRARPGRGREESHVDLTTIALGLRRTEV